MDATSTIDHATDLEVAADVWRTRPWTRGEITSPDGGCDVIGALLLAVYGRFDVCEDDHPELGARFWAAEWALTEYIREQGDGRYATDALNWNDTECLGREDATRMLRAAAAWWRTQAST